MGVVRGYRPGRNHATSAVGCGQQSFSIEGKIIDAAAVVGTGAGSGAGAGKKLFIDTSGILVHGHSDQVRWGVPVPTVFPVVHCRSTLQVVNENTPTNFEGLPPVLKGRIAVEQAVISAKSVDGVVIRPGFVRMQQRSPHTPHAFSCSHGSCNPIWWLAGVRSRRRHRRWLLHARC